MTSNRSDLAGFGFRPLPKARRDADKHMAKAFGEWKAELDGNAHKALVASWLLFVLCYDGCDEGGSFREDAEVLESAVHIYDTIWDTYPELETSLEQVKADLEDLSGRGWFLIEPWEPANGEERFRVLPGPSCPPLEPWMALADVPLTLLS